MNAKDSALNELRLATRQAHDDLEKNMAIVRPGAGREAYVAYVAAMWGWLAPIESRLWDAAWPSGMGAEERSRKSEWLESDLRATGLDETGMHALPRSPYRPALHSMAERFGVAYVIEGSQLGTQVLRKMLAPALDPWTPRWLQGYGEQTSARWRNFVLCTEQSLNSPAEREAASSAARDAFVALTSWFRMQGIA